MPNFWSTTTQAIYECFNGPRTRDVEFEAKQTEMKNTINQVNFVRRIILSFPNRVGFLIPMCQEVYNNFPKIFDEKSIYYPFIQEICNAHRDIEACTKACSEGLTKLKEMSAQWEKMIMNVKENLKKREESRKIYDHYDQKMEGIVKDKNAKLSKGQPETKDEIDYFERVK
ncbi:MAG: hypothetical protein MJ252_08395 [archaeon]|nr:hypothetical protein [archaeon]